MMRIDKAHRLHIDLVPKRLHAQVDNRIIACIVITAISLTFILLADSLI